MITTNSAQQFNQQPIVPPQPILKPTNVQLPVMESKIDGVSLVSSDDQITRYPVTGGATVALIDLARNLLVLKTNDIYYGKGLYYDTYDIKKREPVQQQVVQNESAKPNNDPSSELMAQVQADIAGLKKEYDEIYKMLEELTAPKKEG